MKKTVSVSLDGDLADSLVAFASRKNVSVSKIVSDALQEYFLNFTDQNLKGFLDRKISEISQENNKHVKAAAFFSASCVEMLRVLILFFGGDKEKFKKIWQQVFEIADERVEQMTGEKVWEKSVDLIGVKKEG